VPVDAHGRRRQCCNAIKSNFPDTERGSRTESDGTCGKSRKFPGPPPRIDPNPYRTGRPRGPGRQRCRTLTAGKLRMIKFWKTGAGVILVTAAMMAPASAAEPVRTDAA